MKRKRKALTLLAAAAAAAIASTLAACGGSEEPGGTDQARNAVKISGFLFKPERLSVEAGVTVTWTNADDIAHTVTAGTPEERTGAFDSRDKTKGQSFSHTFPEAGTFPYFCNNHQSMRGEVDVT